jgi:hypothetical protein
MVSYQVLAVMIPTRGAGSKKRSKKQLVGVSLACMST